MARCKPLDATKDKGVVAHNKVAMVRKGFIDHGGGHIDRHHHSFDGGVDIAHQQAGIVVALLIDGQEATVEIIYYFIDFCHLTKNANRLIIIHRSAA